MSNAKRFLFYFIHFIYELFNTDRSTQTKRDHIGGAGEKERVEDRARSFTQIARDVRSDNAAEASQHVQYAIAVTEFL